MPYRSIRGAEWAPRPQPTQLHTIKKKKDKKSKKSKKSKEDKKRKFHRHSDDDDEGSSSGNDSDLDLDKDLKPIGFYVRQRDQMLGHMFKSIGKRKLKAMLPEILKTLSISELKEGCLQQLQVMSKKRIRRILEGADPEEISSSGTEDETSDPEDGEVTLDTVEQHPADSTSQLAEQEVTVDEAHHEDDSDETESTRSSPGHFDVSYEQEGEDEDHGLASGGDDDHDEAQSTGSPQQPPTSKEESEESEEEEEDSADDDRELEEGEVVDKPKRKKKRTQSQTATTDATKTEDDASTQKEEDSVKETTAKETEEATADEKEKETASQDVVPEAAADEDMVVDTPEPSAEGKQDTQMNTDQSEQVDTDQKEEQHAQEELTTDRKIVEPEERTVEIHVPADDTVTMEDATDEQDETQTVEKKEEDVVKLKDIELSVKATVKTEHAKYAAASDQDKNKHEKTVDLKQKAAKGKTVTQKTVDVSSSVTSLKEEDMDVDQASTKERCHPDTCTSTDVEMKDEKVKMEAVKVQKSPVKEGVKVMESPDASKAAASDVPAFAPKVAETLKQKVVQTVTKKHTAPEPEGEMVKIVTKRKIIRQYRKHRPSGEETAESTGLSPARKILVRSSADTTQKLPEHSKKVLSSVTGEPNRRIIVRSENPQPAPAHPAKKKKVPTATLR